MRFRARTAVFALLLLLTDATPASAAAAPPAPTSTRVAHVPAPPAPLAALRWHEPAYAAATSDAPDSIPSEVTLPGGSTVLRETAIAGAAIGIVPWIAYGATAFVGASRVVGNHHWFSDVMAGAVIGRFFGRLMTHNDVSYH